MEDWVYKLAASMGSGLPDPSTAPASSAPVPQPAFENKPPPGQKGPKGLAGRQTFSRVNTGLPPIPDAGQMAQKNMPPMGNMFLPKTAQLENNSMTASSMSRPPSLHDIVKTAMEASASKVDVSLEMARQAANNGDVLPEGEKTASAEEENQISNDYLDKLAGALTYIASSIKTAEPTTAAMGPGQGPQSLDTNKGKLPTEDLNVDNSGEATQKPDMSPKMKAPPGAPSDPGNVPETNVDMSHGEQPVEPISNEKAAQAQYVNNLIAVGLLKVAADDSGQVKTHFANDLVKQAFSAADAGSYMGSTAGGMAGGGLAGAAKGGLAGAAGGGLLGAGGGAVLGGLTGGAPGALMGAATGAGLGATVGGAGGALLGGSYGAGKGAVQGAKRAYRGGEKRAAKEDYYANREGALGLNTLAPTDPRQYQGNADLMSAMEAGAGVGGMIPGGFAGYGAARDIGLGAGGKLLGAAGGALVGGTLGRAAGRTLASPFVLAQHGKASLGAMQEDADAKQASILNANLAALGLSKQAEDALNPAKISAAGGTVDPAKPPEGVAPAEEGVPNEPSDVNAQKGKMLSSNDAAINYTKRDAKADPKSDMGDVIKEPAQTDSTDKVLDTAFDHTDEAGAKISSATRVAAARAILSKLAQEMNGKKKKAMGMAPSPSPSTGAGGSTAPVNAEPVM